ncbi:MAG TPA: DUF1425 domain-containing protein [Victivallales bacterium]|nr:DUF1425 domain-containing protein [Victivallales bacterium]HPO90092.1 DUF1425 domain-containing protein [Victivallales bacterium]HRR05875.1 DUF1425 domain-containing protein [Victivallales bacterium]HRR28444.1 DUF1425 domain-containing protein [Victivallales bacterium]HRU00696.1 DUF1425 domain-containing protein [Victivallales bacterium]
MKGRIAIFSIVTVITLTFCSCNNPVNTVENADKNYERNFIRNKRVEANEYLAKKIQIDSVDLEELPGGLIKAQVTVRNIKRADIKVAYKFQWFNASGIEVSTSAQPWLEKILLGGEVVYLSSVSPNPNCKDFKILLKEME